MIKFGLVGDGIIAKRHKTAIFKSGGQILRVYDPLKYP